MYSQFIVPLVFFALFLSFLQQASMLQQYLPLVLLDEGERNAPLVAVQENNDEIVLLQNQWSPASILRRRHETNNVTLNFSSSSISMLVVPEHVIREYIAAHTSTSKLECPLRFYVYPNDMFPSNFTTDLENKIVAILRNDDRVQENVILEYGLLNLFRTSPCRVPNQTDADVSIVPYMHAAHCIYGGIEYSTYCRGVNKQDSRALLSSMPLFNKTNHVFLLGWGAYMSNLV